MFRATFIFGPMQGQWLDLAAPAIPNRLFFAKAPGELPEHFAPSGWMLVGYDQRPEADWPDQVEYVVDRSRSVLEPHPDHVNQETGEAVYILAGDA